MTDEIDRAIPEVSLRALEAEQLRQLRACQIEGKAGLEPDEDRFRKECHGIAGANEPRQDRDQRQQQRESGGERGMAGRISTAHRADRGAGQQ